MKRQQHFARPSLPKVDPLPRFYWWSIDWDADGKEIWTIIEMSFALDHEKGYTTAPARKKFVTDGAIVYMTSEGKVSMSEAEMIEALKEWRAGKWKKTRLSNKR